MSATVDDGKVAGCGFVDDDREGPPRALLGRQVRVRAW
jgi:hypothetical protein